MSDEMLGTSPAMAAVREQLSRLLALPGGTTRRLPPVLIQGETGTGKGLIAHTLHQRGPRASATFVDVNCAAIPETLLEAELFGFERGAFTDARQPKAGLLQIAHRGTLFLDEIGLMHEALQAKLLKAIEERTVRRLGGTRSEPADAWILAATSEDLSLAIRERRFREDLYHRLAVMTLRLPPLRQRGGDVLLLAHHYLARACAEYGIALRTFSSDAEAALTAYSWPGNVRELANLMERVALLSEHRQITAAVLALPAEVAPEPSPQATGVDDQLAALECRRIEDALTAEQGNLSRAAARLGLARNTLRYRMQRHGLTDNTPHPRRRGGAARDSGGTGNADAGMLHAHESPVQWQRTRVTMLRCVVRTEGDAAIGSNTLDALVAKVVGFGGRILDVDASSFDAAFGLELVEDAACHAAHAASAIQHESSRRPVNGRRTAIAVHTAEMLVGHFTDRVEIATDARLQAAAVLDDMLKANGEVTVTVSAGAKLFLEHRFRLAPVHASESSRTPVWTLVGLVESPRLTPFVSRVRELSVLEGLLAHAEAGLGSAVLVAGDAGMGKSRLLQELGRRTESRITWLRGTAASYGTVLPFHPLIDLLRRALALQPSDSDDTIRQRLDRAVAELPALSPVRLSFLRALLSIDPGDASFAHLDPKLRRAGIFDAVRDYLRATSEIRPLAILLEDAHWFDQATAEFLPALIDELAASAVLLCVTTRTGYPLPVPEHVFGTRMTLQRMTAQESLQMARAVLDTPDVSPQLQRLIDDKSEGNPFFVEEMMRSLQERDLIDRRAGESALSASAARLDVPDRVEDVILGRLGRLDAGTREVLQVAAVIGREFSRPILERVVDRPADAIDGLLRELLTAGLVTAGGMSASSVYAFRHALTHDVAYNSLQELDRRVMHGRIGDAIEAEYAGRLAEHVGVLAHHFTRARRWNRALEHLLTAAEIAERAFATREALALYDEALVATEHASGSAGDPATLIRIHEAKARLYFVTSDFERSAAAGEQILPLARLTADRTKESEALATIAWAATWGRNLDAAIRAARQSLAVAEPAGALAVQGRALFTIGWVRAVTGVLDESEQAITRALTISHAAGDSIHQSLALTTAGLLRNWTGDFDDAARLQTEGLALARERGLLVPLLFNCFLRGLTLVGRGDYDLAFEGLQEGLSLAERVGDEAIHHRLLNCLAWLYADLGDLEEAERLNAASARIGRRRRDPGTQPNAELNLGDIFHARGDVAAAQDLYDGVFRYWKNPSTSEWMRFRYSIRMFASLGELALVRGDLSAARAHAAECLELATRTGARKNLVKGLRLSGALASAEGNDDRAEADLRRALTIAESLRNPVQHWKTLLALHDLLRRQQRDDAARDACQAALRIMTDVGGTLRNERLKQAFERNTDVRRATAFLAT